MIKPIIAAVIALGIIGGGSYGAIEVSTQSGHNDRATPTYQQSQTDTGNTPAEILPNRNLTPSREIAPLPTIVPIVPRNRQPSIIPLPDQSGSTSCYSYSHSNFTDCTGPGGSTSCYSYSHSNFTDCTTR